MDLDRWLRGEPIEARPVRPWVRLAKWVKRRPAIASLSAAVVLVAMIGIYFSWSAHAHGLVNQLLKAKMTEVPGIINAMSGYRWWVDPALHKALKDHGPDSPEHLHASLALLPDDPSQADFLHDRMLEGSAVEVEIIGNALQKDHQKSLIPKLWSVMEAAKRDDPRCLPAASALALFDPQSQNWAKMGDKVGHALVKINPTLLGDWTKALVPVRGRLTQPLATIFRDQKRPESESLIATTILADYANDDGALLAELLMDSEPSAFATLYPFAEKVSKGAIPRLQAEIQKSLKSDWQDAPLPPSWITPDSALDSRIKDGEGSLRERYAYCQTMTMDEFVVVAEQLRKSGYRPTRFRPYADGSTLKVAAVWTRDGRNWILKSGLRAEEARQADQQNQKDGYRPVDVAGYVTEGKDGKPAEQYAALWVKRDGPDEKIRLHAGVVGEQLKTQEGFVPSTMQAFVGLDGKLKYSGVWFQSNSKGEALLNQTQLSFRTRLVTDMTMIVSDVGLSGSEAPSSRERAKSALDAAETDLKNRPVNLDARFARAKALYGLSEWQKALDDLNMLVEKFPKVSAYYQYRSLTHAHLRHKDEALSDLAKFQEGNGSEINSILAVVVTAELGEEEADALAALEDAVKNNPGPDLLYNAACAYSLASVPVSARDNVKGSAYAETATALLAEAILRGYLNHAQILEGSDLDPIRNAPGYLEAIKLCRPDRRYSAALTAAANWEVEAVSGIDDAAARQKRFDELESNGYRPVSFSVAKTSADGRPVAASVWQRPLVTEEMKDQLAERQARAAVALARMGKAEEVWPLLKHSENPRLRSFIVNWLSPLGADSGSLINKIDRLPAIAKPTPAQGQHFMDAVLFHPENSMRRALIHSLGTYGKEKLSPGESESLIGKLLGLYRDDPDAGIHGAAEWTLRQLNQEEKLKTIDTELMKLKGKEWGDRRWFIDSLGQTFTIVDGPVEFMMGSPRTEPERNYFELLTKVPTPGRYAIASKEVSKKQFQAFMKDHPEFEPDAAQVKKHSPEVDGPMVGFTWYAAAAFCNWLSERDGLDEGELCYIPNDQRKYDAGMKITADFLTRKGYRLPTDAEWEYACRSGALTSRYYGHSPTLLNGYARYQANSKNHAWARGNLLPNDLGLFDMLGNTNEWIHNTLDTNNQANILQIREDVRVLRGGGFNYPPASIRSADRNGNNPSFHGDSIGFRPARTYP